MNGCLGVHVEANSEGYSRDRALQAARNIGGKYATIVNDPMLCMMLLDVGVTPIHRINRQGLLDDNQDQYNTTRLYIQTANIEVPDKRALLHWNNEPANNMPRLLKEGLVAIDEAVRLGRTLVMLNFSYGNPEPADHEYLAPLYRRMAETGMIYACHEGTDLKYPTLKDAYPHHIGRFLPIQRKYGFRVLVTEFAASKDAWNGWQTWDSNYAQVCDDTVREVYAPNGVYMTPFTAFKWKTGFDYINSPELQASWAQTNVRYPVTQPTNPPAPPVQPPTSGGVKGVVALFPQGVAFRNIRVQPAASAADIGDLKPNELIVAYVNALVNGWCYIERLSDGVKGWSLWTGVVFAPELLPPAEKTYSMTEAERLVLLDYLTRSLADLTAAKALVEGLAPSNSGGL